MAEALHEIYERLGSVAAQLVRAAEDRADFRAGLAEMSRTIKALAHNFEEHERGYQALKNRGAGILVGIGLFSGVAGAGGAALVAWLHKWMGP